MVGGLVAKWKVGEGIEKYISSLETISNATEELIGSSIFEGAKVVTDSIRSALEGLPVDDHHGATVTGVSTAQKAGLLNGLGITTMRRDDGTYNVKVGFDGYNVVKTKRWPQGQPNSMIARSLESGTSFRAKNPVISKATRSAKAQAEQAMAKAFDDALQTKINI